MSHALADFTQADCERKEPTAGDMPPFRFVPDDPTARAYTTFPVYGGTESNGKKEMELCVQQYDGEGPIEDLLKWWLSVLKLIAMKPTPTTEERFFLIPKCLSEAGSIQELWAQAKTEAVLLEERDKDDELVELGRIRRKPLIRQYSVFQELATRGERRRVKKVHAVLFA